MARTKRNDSKDEVRRITRPYHRKSRRQLLREFEQEYIQLNKNSLIQL